VQKIIHKYTEIGELRNTAVTGLGHVIHTRYIKKRPGCSSEDGKKTTTEVLTALLIRRCRLSRRLTNNTVWSSTTTSILIFALELFKNTFEFDFNVLRVFFGLGKVKRLPSFKHKMSTNSLLSSFSSSDELHSTTSMAFC
jgi:hypothetical protein